MIRIVATHADPEVGTAAYAALTKLGFNQIQVQIDTQRKVTVPSVTRYTSKWDSILVPSGKSGVDNCFYKEKHWRWVKVWREAISEIKYVLIYETKLDSLDGFKSNGRGAVVAYAPVIGHHTRPSDSKTDFRLGEIVTLPSPIPGDGVGMQNLRYCKLEKMLKAKTLADVFTPSRKSHA